MPVLARAAVATRRRRGVHGNPSRIPRRRSPTAPTPGRCKHMKALLETLKDARRAGEAARLRGDRGSAVTSRMTKLTIEPATGRSDERDRRRDCTRDSGFARQSDRRGGRAARVRRDGPRRRALGRLDRQPRGDRAARRRPQRYLGKGVLQAVENVNTEICEAIIGLDAIEQTLRSTRR